MVEGGNCMCEEKIKAVMTQFAKEIKKMVLVSKWVGILSKTVL